MKATWHIAKSFTGVVGALGVVACANTSSTDEAWRTAVPGSAFDPPPKNAAPYSDFLMAKYAGLVQDRDAASNFYRRAHRHTPNDKDLLERAVYYALMSGDTVGAASLAQKASDDMLIKAPLADLVKLVDEFNQLRFESVRERMNAPMRSAFYSDVAIGLAAWSDVALGDAVAGAARYDDANQNERGMDHFTQGLLLSAGGFDDEAMAKFKRGWELGYRWPVAVDAYARLMAVHGRPDFAARLVQDFNNDVGDNPLLDALSKELAATGTAKAKRYKAGEGAAAAVLALAVETLAAGGSQELSAVYLRLALTLDPGQHAARLTLADVYHRQERNEDALFQLDQVAQPSAYFGAAQARKAWVYKSIGDDGAAIRAAMTSLDHKPGRSIQANLGDLFRELSHNDKAEIVYDSILAQDESIGRLDWRIVFARGAARERLGRWNEAEADLQYALRLAPNRPEIMNYLGYSWVDRGQNIEQAFRLIRKAVEQRPDAGYIIDSLGWAYYRLGRYEDAVIQLERAVELEPADPEINDHLGDAYWRIGAYDRARYQWEKVPDLAPTSDMAARIKLKLSEGLDGANARLVEVHTPQ